RLAQSRARRCLHIGVTKTERRRAVFADAKVGDRFIVQQDDEGLATVLSHGCVESAARYSSEGRSFSPQRARCVTNSETMCFKRAARASRAAFKSPSRSARLASLSKPWDSSASSDADARIVAQLTSSDSPGGCSRRA